jgi:hypothetical protein
LEEPLEWNSTLLKGDVVGDLRKLRHQPGDTLLIYGSGALVDTLMRLAVASRSGIVAVWAPVSRVGTWAGHTRTGDGHGRPPTDRHRSGVWCPAAASPV